MRSTASPVRWKKCCIRPWRTLPGRYGRQGRQARSVRLELPPFTLVGAPTRAGDLSAPLRDRFGIVSKLEYYTNEQLAAIVRRTSRVLGVTIEGDAVMEIARRSRGTPRIANRLLRRIRDFAQVLNNGVISKEIAQESLDRLHVDSLGLDEVDIRYLRGIIDRFKGGPVGLEALANSISEETTTLEDVYEPYLIQIGFVNRTTRGRVVTEKAYEHLGIRIHCSRHAPVHDLSVKGQLPAESCRPKRRRRQSHDHRPAACGHESLRLFLKLPESE